jgi:hypothetical protein
MGWRDFLMDTPVHYVHKVHKEALDTPLIGLNVLNVHGDGVENGITHSPNRGKSIEEATKLFKNRGWVQIYSGHLKQSIILVRDEKVKPLYPTLPKYTQAEIQSLKDLTLDELKTLHEAKVLFEGTII